jgi:hypothetical protein
MIIIHISTPTNVNSVSMTSLKASLKSVNPDYFPDNIQIEWFGCINNDFQVYITKLIWGNFRETKRLIFLSRDNKYLGNYYLDELPDRIEDKKIIFKIKPKWGNIIDFSNGIPHKIYIDGHTYEFEQAK